MALTVVAVSRQGDISSTHLLVVDVVLENVSLEEATYDYFYFSILDPIGVDYAVTIEAPEPGLQWGDLVPGSEVRGNIAFEVEPDTHGLTLVYDPGILSGAQEPLRVNLGQ